MCVTTNGTVEYSLAQHNNPTSFSMAESTQLQTGPYETLQHKYVWTSREFAQAKSQFNFTVPLSAVVRVRCKCSESVTQLCVQRRFHSPHIKIINMHCARYRTHADAYMALYDASIHKGNEHRGSIKLPGNRFCIRHTQNHVLREQSAYCKQLN